MVGEVVADVVAMDTGAVLRLSDTLVRGGDAVAGGAPPIGGRIELPEDRFDLAARLVDLDAARSAYDARFGEGLRDAGARLAGVALDVLTVDGTPVPIALPAAATTSCEVPR